MLKMVMTAFMVIRVIFVTVVLVLMLVMVVMAKQDGKAGEDGESSDLRTAILLVSRPCVQGALCMLHFFSEWVWWLASVAEEHGRCPCVKMRCARTRKFFAPSLAWNAPLPCGVCQYAR